MMLPPGLSTETSLRKARSRWLGGTWCQTALTQTRSKDDFDLSTFSNAGSLSSSQRILDNLCRALPASRNFADGSTAITL